MNRLLIVVLFGVSALFSMEEAPVVDGVPEKKLRLTKLYEQLRPQRPIKEGYYDALHLVSLPQKLSENCAYLDKLKAEQPDAEEIIELEVEIFDAQSIIMLLQVKFDQTRSKREHYRFSK